MSSTDTRIDRFQFRELRIPFKVAFRHASAERAETETVWIDASAVDGTTGSGESCPRRYVTDETLSTARAFVDRYEIELRREIADVEDLKKWASSHRTEIDANPAAWCALELAMLDLFGKRIGVPVESLLSVPSVNAESFRYTAVLGDGPPPAFHAMAGKYWEMGFRDFKVKLSADSGRDREKLAVFDQWSGGVQVRADANNLWETAEDAIAGLGRLGRAFVAIEEPIGKGNYRKLSEISAALGCPIILDESCTRRDQLVQLEQLRSQWLINIRVSKMGGLIRSLEVISAARGRGFGVIIGAQVGETSLLTRAALTVARAAGDMLVAQEGAFGTYLLERDVCDPPLMFAEGGVLAGSKFPMLTQPGLGSFQIQAHAGPS